MCQKRLLSRDNVKSEIQNVIHSAVSIIILFLTPLYSFDLYRDTLYSNFSCIYLNRNIHIMFFLIFIPLMVNAANRVIEIKGPYDSGSFWVNINESFNLQNIDTVSFSNGVRIFFHPYIADIDILERNEYPSYLLLDTTSFYIAGYRFNVSLTRTIDPFWYRWGVWSSPWNDTCYSTATRNNPDTNWNEALSFPDSLFPLDSICYYITLDTIYMTFGKEAFINYLSMLPIDPPHGNLSENYNAIMYIKSHDSSSMKIQIAEGELIKSIYTISANDTTYQSRIENIHIRWAVDDDGDMQFLEDFTPVFKEQIREYNTPKITVRYINNTALIESPDRKKGLGVVKVYGLQGALIAERNCSSGQLALDFLPVGHYIVTANVKDLGDFLREVTVFKRSR